MAMTPGAPPLQNARYLSVPRDVGEWMRTGIR
jgi:hypothetical protein